MNNLNHARKLYYSIGEVSEVLNIKEHVLRYWESEFKMLKPAKSPNGHRKYKEKDIEVIKEIKTLLWDEGLKIASAKKRLADKHKMNEFKAQMKEIGTTIPAGIEEIKKELRSVLELLRVG